MFPYKVPDSMKKSIMISNLKVLDSMRKSIMISNLKVLDSIRKAMVSNLTKGNYQMHLQLVVD